MMDDLCKFYDNVELPPFRLVKVSGWFFYALSNDLRNVNTIFILPPDKSCATVFGCRS